MVEVAVAVLERPDGAFLLAQRPRGRVYAGWWEFPGGKIEAGETPEAALARELQEELGVGVGRAYPWITREHTYSHARVRLHFFRVVEWSGEPRAKEHETIGAEPMREQVERRLASGLRLLQIRDKGLSPGAREALARSVVALAHRYGARALVNSDIDLARRVGADGVHWAARDLMELRARPEGLLAGASCHDAAELAHAVNLEFDFAVLGPVNPTATHPGAATLGWTRFAGLASGIAIPVYAIGGLASADLEDARRAGAHGIAMIRGAWR
jgi:8-oxo-dGTP diphosphatase